MIKSRNGYSENLESQYRRMGRIYEEIIKDFESTTFSKSSQEKLDKIYDFFLICYHLREWVKKDTKVGQTIKDKLPTFEKEDSPVHLKMCRDLCNRSKHATLETKEHYKPNDANTKIVTYGGAIFSVPKKELKEARNKKETIHLKDEDGIFLGNFYVTFKGRNYDLKGVVQACMHEWKVFFEENDLLLPRSTPFPISPAD